MNCACGWCGLCFVLRTLMQKKHCPDPALLTSFPTAALSAHFSHESMPAHIFSWHCAAFDDVTRRAGDLHADVRPPRVVVVPVFTLATQRGSSSPAQNSQFVEAAHAAQSLMAAHIRCIVHWSETRGAGMPARPSLPAPHSDEQEESAQNSHCSVVPPNIQRRLRVNVLRRQDAHCATGDPDRSPLQSARTPTISVLPDHHDNETTNEANISRTTTLLDFVAIIVWRSYRLRCRSTTTTPTTNMMTSRW